MKAPLEQRYWQFGLLLAGAILAPLIAPNDYVVGVLARICLYSMLALGLNIVVGFAGLLDIGYVAFFGIGSYVYAFLASPHFGIHLPFIPAMIIVVVVTGVSGIIIGAPTLRLRGDYLAIVTLGFGEITYICLVNLDRPINITGGPSGLIRIDPPSLFGLSFDSNRQYYYLFLLTLGALIYASIRLRALVGLGGRYARMNLPLVQWGSTRWSQNFKHSFLEHLLQASRVVCLPHGNTLYFRITFYFRSR